MKPRRSGYTWATWLTGLLSADDSCRWAAWAKTNFTYEKRPDANADRLSVWKAEHGDLVEQHAATLRADGWTVTLEGQNKITIEGRSTTLACAPDIVAHKGNVVLISDAKTGQRKGKDLYQVRIYLMTLPMTKRFPEGTVYSGQVVYRDGTQSVSYTVDDKARILALLAEVGDAKREPVKVPSVGECAHCPIAACTARVEEAAAAVATTEF